MQLSEIADWGLYLAAMVLLALRRMLSPCTGWNSSGWAGGQCPPCLWLRPIRALIFLSTFITSALAEGPLLTEACVGPLCSEHRPHSVTLQPPPLARY